MQKEIVNDKLQNNNFSSEKLKKIDQKLKEIEDNYYKIKKEYLELKQSIIPRNRILDPNYENIFDCAYY
jgi:hypothetical protein